MPKDRKPEPPPAANDNAVGGAVDKALHMFARLLGKQAARDVLHQQLQKKTANDNTVGTDIAKDKDIT